MTHADYVRLALKQYRAETGDLTELYELPTGRLYQILWRAKRLWKMERAS